MPTDLLHHYRDKPERLVIGLMSGTSADGIDAALCRLSGSGESLRAAVADFVCTPYTSDLRAALLALFTPEAPVGEVARMNVLLGRLFAEAALDLMRRAGLSPRDVDLIASHGQTMCHLPADAATVQIGEPAVIAELTGLPVVADFRARDMAAGGQGAPLVPYADYVLFRDPHRTRAIQNIGGIANVTLLPAGGGIGDVLAFDTGPGNMVIDALVAALSDGARRYDENGAWAEQGRVSKEMLDVLAAHPFLSRPPPKSTGREDFGAQFAAELLASARARGLSEADTIATATAFTAASIADAYRQFILPKHRLDEVILGGGGSYNRALVRMLAERLPGVPLRTHEDYGISGEAKEALAFAILGNETMCGRPANVPAATGASHAVVLGKIVLP
jgi:anhydro-N-acetylmuramic acid kinase